VEPRVPPRPCKLKPAGARAATNRSEIHG
jgi:hypothetical protein